MASSLTALRTSGKALEWPTADGRWLRIRGRGRLHGGIVLVCTDITEMKDQQTVVVEAQNHLERVSGASMTLVQNLSHELRTPLSAVLGFAELMAGDLTRKGDAEHFREYAGEIHNAADYMLTLVNNLLDLARVQARRLDLQDEPCDLTRLVAATMSLVAKCADSMGVAVTVALPATPTIIQADATLVRQMLTNLISNAIKFSAPTHGQVEVSIERTGDGGLELVVKDTGIGMFPDQIPHALSPFGQVHDPALISEKGTGLGLPLTKALIEQHGGSLVIRSAPGAGTETRLVFPRERVRD